MKRLSEPFLLAVIGVIAVGVICVSGIGLEYGWFAKSQPIADASFSSSVDDVTNTKGAINLNTASVAQLKKLPGIGETLAKEIVGYRIMNGNYNSLDQLLEVQGMREDILYEITPYITIE